MVVQHLMNKQIFILFCLTPVFVNITIFNILKTVLAIPLYACSLFLCPLLYFCCAVFLKGLRHVSISVGAQMKQSALTETRRALCTHFSPALLPNKP